MDDQESDNNNIIHSLINEFYVKNKNDINISKLQKFCEEKNITLNDFYLQLMDELTAKLEGLNNIIKYDDLLTTYKNDILLDRILVLISLLNNAVQFTDKENKNIDEYIYNSFDFILNIIMKIGNKIKIYTKEKKNNLKDLIDTFRKQIIRIFKNLYENYNQSIEHNLEITQWNNILIKEIFCRNILYDILEITITNQKDINIAEKAFDHKGSLKLINDIINYLINEIKISNIKDIIDLDVKTILNKYKDHLFLIKENILNLLKKIVEIFNSEKEIKILYEELFSFMFNDIVFFENAEYKYNTQFLEILFELYNYLIKQKNNPVIDIFLIKLFHASNSNFSLVEDIQKSCINRYKWLLKETEYKKVILNSMPKVFNESIFAFYSGALMYMMNPPNKQKGYVPEEDLIIFFENFENYLNNENYKKEYLINFFAKKISDLMNMNANVVKIVLQKCNIFNIIMKLIEAEKENDIKIKLIELIEKILGQNKENIEYNFEIDIRKEMNDDINYKINLFTVGYEYSPDKYNDKISQLINLMEEYINNKKIIEVIQIVDFIFKIISGYQFKKINVLSEENINNFNNLLTKISGILSNSTSNELKNNEDELIDFINKYLNLILKFIIQFNLKKFDYKLSVYEVDRYLFYSKKIIKKKTLKSIIKNFILSPNYIIKKNTFELLLYISIDEKNNLIVSSFFLYIIINIYYKEKDYENIQKLLNIILNFIRDNEINAQILLYYDFVSIILNILDELYGKENENYKECYKSIYAFFEEISKYLNQDLLIIYLNKIFALFKRNILNHIKEKEPLITPLNEQEENNERLSDIFNDEEGEEDLQAQEENNNSNNLFNETEEDKKRKNIAIKEDKENIENLEKEKNKEISYNKLCFNLLELLKKKFEENYNKDNYIIISNCTFPNHLINNLLYFDNLKFQADKDIYLGFKLILKINSYKGINGFILLQLLCHNNSLSFIIENNTLEIKENSNNILNKIDNFDKECPEGEYHNIIVNIDTRNKTFGMIINNKTIITKTKPYKHFKFDNFNAIIGFDNSSVNYKAYDLDSKLSELETNSIKKNNRDSEKDGICFVYISYLLFHNTLIGNNNINNISMILENEKKKYLNPNLLNHFFRIGHINTGKNLIAEVDFQTRKTKISCTQKIVNKKKEKNFFLNSNNNIFINRYLSCKKNINNFNQQTPITYMYMLSKNNNIHEFCSLNKIWKLEEINKSYIESKLFDNYYTKMNLFAPAVIDFMLGFFFLIERRFIELKNINKENGGQMNEREEEDIDLTNEDEDIILFHILEMFEIIFLFPEDILKEYFKETGLLKFKYFFYRNIFLFKTNEDIVEKFLNIFLKDDKNIIFLVLFISIIFFDINIFAKLDSAVQNKIIDYLFNNLDKIELKTENREIMIHFQKIIISCLNLIFFIELDSFEIQGKKSQIEILLDIINKILLKIKEAKFLEEEKILGKIFFEINNNICLGFEKHIDDHLDKDIYKKYNYIFSNEGEEYIEDEGYLETKLKKLAAQINKYYKSMKDNEIIISLIKIYIEKNKDNINIECPFCAFFKKLCYEKSKFIYEEYTYIKYYNQFFRNYFQNFGDNPDIFKKNNYAWFLSLKESRGKMQSKFFLKENLIKDLIYINPKTNTETLYFQYMVDEEQYKQKFKEFNKLFFYDLICKHDKLITALNPDLEIEKENYYNCLIINKLRKILSTFILYKDRIIIYYSICLDVKNKIHIVHKSPIPHILWLIPPNDFNTELSRYIEDNEKEIKEDFYTIKNIKKNEKPKLAFFNYNKNKKFIRKIIYLNKINEIHKREYLHFPNSLEIFLENGDSYFLVFSSDIRELVFDNIISNIDNLYKSKPGNKLPNFKSQKLQTLPNKENIFYMKHTPLLYITQSELDHFLKNSNYKKDSLNKLNIRSIIDGNSFKDFIVHHWTKNRINNYDYIMFLNTLSGRGLNDLSQYIIFPWIIKDFDKEILNWMSNSIYRDLTLPIYAVGNDLEKIKEKYELLDDEKYHSGTFYSTHNFVCYFLVRLHPFTEIHLEIQGARFDAPGRMFNGVKQLSEVSEKLQELIPHLYYSPESYVKLNYYLEDIAQDDEIIKDFVLPSWSKDDPRKFSLILRKLLESNKVSKNLNHWIDLIFGFQQRGPNAEKVLNTYRESVYPLSKADFEEMRKSGEIESYLYEKEEFGCMGKQLFTSKHKEKEVNNKKIGEDKIFFNSNDKIENLTFEKIKHEHSNLNKKIAFQKYNDIIYPDNQTMNNRKSKSYYQSGISSLPSIINIAEEYSVSKIKKGEIIRNLKNDQNFFILKDNYFYLSKFELILTYNRKFIELINIGEKEKNEIEYYLLIENAEISCLTINSNGTKIFVGFTNGIIHQYKIIKMLLNGEKLDKFYIKQGYQSQLETNSKIYNDIFFNKDHFLKKEEADSNIYLELINENNFNNNNPHIYKKINLLGLNESHNVLIALDQNNMIYILSINNNFKLMHKITFLSKFHFKMKEIIPLQENGDFIIYSSYSVNLFSINGVPLCSLNLFEKEYEDLNIITCCKAVFIYDVTLFTAHKDGSIILWKILNKDLDEDKNCFKEYKYCYNYRNYMNSGIKLSDIKLNRRFEKIVYKNLSEEKKKKTNDNYFTFMKMSNDLSYMILLDNNKNIYILSSSLSSFKSKKSSFMEFMMSKPKCANCGKELKDQGMRATLVSSNFMDYDFSESLNDNPQQKTDNNKNIICEECQQKLTHTENFLYTY